MGEVIEFPMAQGASLLVEEMGGIYWYRCVLKLDTDRREIGASSREYILDHLKTVIEPRESVATEDMDGKAISWVMSLHELHTTLYVHHGESGSKELFWQDRAGNIFASTRLDAFHVREWCRVLAGTGV